MDPRTPVVVGAAQLSHHGDPGEPLALAVEAARAAGEDSGTGDALLRGADSFRCVPTTCCPSRARPALAPPKVGAPPREPVQPAQSGADGPQLLIADTAAGIAAGDVDV